MQKYAFLGGLFETVKDYSKKELLQSSPILKKFINLFDRMEKDRVISKGKFKHISVQDISYVNSPFFDVLYDYIFLTDVKNRYGALSGKGLEYWPLSHYFYEFCENHGKEYRKWLENKTITVHRSAEFNNYYPVLFHVILSTKGSTSKKFYGTLYSTSYFLKTEEEVRRLEKIAEKNGCIIKHKQVFLEYSAFSAENWYTLIETRPVHTGVTGPTGAPGVYEDTGPTGPTGAEGPVIESIFLRIRESAGVPVLPQITITAVNYGVEAMVSLMQGRLGYSYI